MPLRTVVGGGYQVFVDPAHCENKRECIEVCPTDVFEMIRPEVSGLLLRLKIRLHGGVIAAPVREADCIGCMACVTACPESAIAVTAGRVSGGS
jgi:NAD-dependent dihydropyrimidine dehydrogenase PreA subunit